jgi:hypothetical protein
MPNLLTTVMYSIKRIKSEVLNNRKDGVKEERPATEDLDITIPNPSSEAS